MGGTVVAEYQACSKCFAGSVFDKKKKKGTQQIFESAECVLPGRVDYEIF